MSCDRDGEAPPPVEEQPGYDPPVDHDTGGTNELGGEGLWTWFFFTCLKAIAGVAAATVLIMVLYLAIQALLMLLTVHPAVAVIGITIGLILPFVLIGGFILRLVDAFIPG